MWYKASVIVCLYCMKICYHYSKVPILRPLKIWPPLISVSNRTFKMWIRQFRFSCTTGWFSWRNFITCFRRQTLGEVFYIRVYKYMYKKRFGKVFEIHKINGFEIEIRLSMKKNQKKYILFFHTRLSLIKKLYSFICNPFIIVF